MQPHNPPRGRAAYRTGHRPEPLDNELIWHKLYTDTFWAKGNGAIIFSAISAIDIAHWDIKGKAAGMPLNQMLGGMQRDGLPEYLSHIQFVLGGPTLDPLFTPAEYADGCRRAVDLGYTAVKINPFRTDEDGRVITSAGCEGRLSRSLIGMLDRRLTACPEGLGTDAELIIDCHSRTNLQSATQFARLAEHHDIWFIEGAVAPMNVGEMRRVNSPTASDQRLDAVEHERQARVELGPEKVPIALTFQGGRSLGQPRKAHRVDQGGHLLPIDIAGGLGGCAEQTHLQALSNVVLSPSVDRQQNRQTLGAGEWGFRKRLQTRFCPGQHIRSGRRSVLRHLDGPRMRQPDLGEAPRPLRQSTPPARSPEPHRHRTAGNVEHHGIQLVLAVEIAIERHRRQTESGGDGLHGHRGQSLGVGDRDRCGADLLDRPPGFRPTASGRLAAPEQLEVARQLCHATSLAICLRDTQLWSMFLRASHTLCDVHRLDES